MHITLRRLLFAFFVLAFVVTAPLVVLYTAGYRLNISNRRLQQTGVLAITTFPRGSNIMLNGQNLAQKTPYVAQRIMPNMHEVVLQKKGYHEWSQRIRVEEGKTSYITARLFADSQPMLLDATQAALALRSRQDTQIITVDEASVTFLNNGENIEVHTGSGTTDQLIALLPPHDYRLLEDDTEYILIADERNAAFMIAREGGAVVELPTHLTAFDWLANEDLLVWTDGAEVNIYAAATNENTFITRDGQSVIDVAWHPEADSVFVATTLSLTVYDRAVYETRETTQLLPGTLITGVTNLWIESSGKNLYYEIVPPHDTQGETLIYQLPLAL